LTRGLLDQPALLVLRVQMGHQEPKEMMGHQEPKEMMGHQEPKEMMGLLVPLALTAQMD
jgi:hypothetical protein